MKNSKTPNNLRPQENLQSDAMVRYNQNAMAYGANGPKYNLLTGRADIIILGE
jgi:hypothetical protein